LTLTAEFYQGEYAQDYDLIDEIIHRLKFFLRFKKPTRIQLIKSSRLIYLEPGRILFKQGDYGDKMYVILKGAVNVVQKLRINDRQFQERV
jgi:CRP-like cAMP-binding protein